MAKPTLRRILVKFSGEALMGAGTFGIDPQVLDYLAQETRPLVAAGVQLALVIGGGNLFRGKALARAGMDPVTGDHMGMLATVMNALALGDALGRAGIEARVLSALRVDAVCEPYVRRRALHHLERGRVVILAAGTGNPFFTTDSAASLRAVELGAELLIKATKVDGVYSADPVTHPEARFYERLSYRQALQEDLGVMDTTAIVLCRDHGIPIRVFNLSQPGALQRVIAGASVGSLIQDREP